MCFHSFLNPSMVGVEEDNGGGAALNYYDFSDLESFISSNGAKLESINCLAIDDDPATPNQHIYDPLSPFISRNKVKLSSNTRERAQRTAPIKQFFSMSPNIINNLKTLPICPFASLSIRLSYPPFVLSIRTYISNPKGLLPAANRFKPPSTLSSSLSLPPIEWVRSLFQLLVLMLAPENYVHSACAWIAPCSIDRSHKYL